VAMTMLRPSALIGIQTLPCAAQVKFDIYGGWYIENDEEKQMNTKQVIGRRREVSSTQERGVRRRKRLVDAARHFLETRDPQKISFKEIAEHAEVPEGSAYHFFANKYDIFGALAFELGEEFAIEAAKTLDSDKIGSWQDFMAVLIDRSAKIYMADPVARKVLLGSTMPNEIKNVDQGNVETYVKTVESLLNLLFEMPQIPRLSKRLVYALTIVDAIFEFDLNSRDNLSDEIIEEAKLAIIGYLSNFIPSDLELKTQE